MTDHAEEQGMEAEALQAIFDTHFSIIKSGQWSVEIYPEMTADLDELDQLNHVGVKLLVELPTNYPEALPILDCQIIKGLVDEHQHEILALAREEATANEGVPSIFAITERVREWLVENNQKGLDDLSMHAQMIRKQQAKEKEVRFIFISTIVINKRKTCSAILCFPKMLFYGKICHFILQYLWDFVGRNRLLKYDCMVKIRYSNGAVRGNRRQGGYLTWLF